MAKSFALSVVSPDRSIVDAEVTSVIAPGHAGYFGVLAGHAPQVAALRPGLVEYTDVEREHRHVIVVGGGFAEVSGQRMTILADVAELAHEIDVQRAERKLDAARRALRGEASDMTAHEATEAMERAISRLRAAKMD